MLKKTAAIVMMAILCMCCFAPQASAALKEELTAPAAILMEADTGKILYEKESHTKRSCASITKIMTLLLVMEAIDSEKIGLQDRVAASAHAASMGGSDIWLQEGEIMSVDDLLKATVIMSANDAAVVLAEYVAGTEDEFVNQMNIRAQELGMDDTTFQNCNGLDEEGHLTSAHDIALMSCELIKYEKIFDYTLVWIDYVRDGATQLVNTNKMIRSYQGITGLKTGTTGEAGSCISATAKRGNIALVSVVLGCATTDDRFRDAAKLLDYGFANWAAAQTQTPVIDRVPVTGGMEHYVDTQVAQGGLLIVPKGREEEIETEVNLQESMTAPVLEGQKIGEIIYRLDGEVLFKREVYAKQAVAEITFSSVFSLLLHSVVRF